MFTTVQSFLTGYGQESATTQQLLDALSDASLQQPQAEGYRPLGFIAWHLVHNDRGMLLGAGLKFEAPSAAATPPKQAAAIADAYRATTKGILEAVRTQLTDAKLQEQVNMFGQQWTIGETLFAYLKHEIHHRGQLTILMRQAGVPVIGAYGPAKEQWASIGMPIPAI
ncbi:DinB family protein [Paenibacillus sp. GCM10023248]|uniref:DinB family protein n=1 Tax=Bacillales TaxID=1385 RepID=UPI00237935FC|nr:MULTISPECIES: DinB family protein [Bacillales]MDD9270562.1 DinB family protein [Paenibacillus sp. MAHUQ-63]MDR6885469.1 putative damage-inducible protein DinB [Bacillus sp. 3255]